MVPRATLIGAAAGPFVLLGACTLLVDTSGLSGFAAPFGDASAEAADALPPDADASDDAESDASDVERYISAVLADSPAAYLRLEERSGSAARDEMNRVVAKYGGTYALGAPGAFAGSAGISLDGAGGGIDLGSAFDFVNRDPFTFELWFLPRSYPSAKDDFRFLFAKDYYAPAPAAERQNYGVWFNSFYEMDFERFIGTSKREVSTPLPAIGTFHHIVASYDGAALRLFIDGSLVASQDETRSGLTKPVSLWIGRRAGDAQSVDGVIDEVAVYDKALSGERVRAHYDASGR